MHRLNLILAVAVLALGGCATDYARRSEIVEKPAAGESFACGAGEARQDCDRRAILAMAGEYRVQFAFDETVPITPGYAKHADQRSGGTEWVEVIEDTPTRISLQHVLVMGDDHTVVKHWRQDWTYEPIEMLAFRGLRRWEKVALAPEQVRGKWLQGVYEVDDSPRYFGLGSWSYDAGVAAWTSGPTWRPLPRREYTKRSDYQVMAATNRHTLMPGGWVHEQDNVKLVLEADGNERALVRESGLNTYARIGDYDFAAGREYWQKTAEFWALVRARWGDVIARNQRIELAEKIDDKPLYEVMFALADRAAAGEVVVAAEVDAALDRYLVPRVAAGGPE